MDKEVISNLSALGFQDIRLYEETGSETYFDGRLPTGERVEIRLKRSKIHYRMFGVASEQDVIWQDMGPVDTPQKGRKEQELESPERSGDFRSDLGTRDEDGANYSQLSLFES